MRTPSTALGRMGLSSTCGAGTWVKLSAASGAGMLHATEPGAWVGDVYFEPGVYTPSETVAKVNRESKRIEASLDADGQVVLVTADKEVVVTCKSQPGNRRARRGQRRKSP